MNGLGTIFRQSDRQSSLSYFGVRIFTGKRSYLLRR